MNAVYTQLYRTNGRPITNPRLIGDMRAEKPEAWEHFNAVYWDWLCRKARCMGVNHEDSKDLALKTFIAAARRMPDFVYQPGKSFSAWLLKVLTRNTRSYWRARKRDPLNCLIEHFDESGRREDMDQFFGPSKDDVIDEMIVREFQRLLEESCAELKANVPSRQWMVFAAYNLADLPVEEVAARHNLRPGSVYSIDSRLARKMRHILERKLKPPQTDRLRPADCSRSRAGTNARSLGCRPKRIDLNGERD